MLRSHSRPSPAGQSKSFGTGSFTLSSIDFEALKTIVALKVLSDPSSRVCQYEVPGGGECRDKDCEDIHLSRLSSVEPTGTHSYLLVLVAYLFISPHFGLLFPFAPRPSLSPCPDIPIHPHFLF